MKIQFSLAIIFWMLYRDVLPLLKAKGLQRGLCDLTKIATKQTQQLSYVLSCKRRHLNAVHYAPSSTP